jgi:thymidylate synthase
MNTADKAYNELLQDILDNGEVHHNRTGTDTLSVFGRQLRFNLQEGFPLLTGKKVYYRAILHEMLWFLGAVPEKYKNFSQTNIKYLVDHGVKIWNEWPYKKYRDSHITKGNPDGKLLSTQLDSVKPIEHSFESFINNIKTDDDFARKWGNLGPVYGKQWTDWGGDISYGFIKHSGINQIQQMIDRLKTNPDCRRIIVSAWNPENLGKMLLPPCHYSFQFKSVVMKDLERQYAFNKYSKENSLEVSGMSTRDAMDHYKFPTRKLHLLFNIRSADCGLGAPFNIASYATLLTMFAQITNHVPSELIASLGDAHIYKNHINSLKEQLTREPRELPKLILNRKIKDIFDFRYSDFEIIGYKPHKTIKMEVAV